LDWSLKADERIHGTTGERPRERFEKERSALGALPERAVVVPARRLLRRVASDALVDVDERPAREDRRVEDHLVRLRMGHVAQRIDAMLSEAARGEPTYLDFLDSLLREEVDSKQRKRVQMGLTIAHFPQARTLEDFDFRFQPSVDQRLVKELSTGRFISLSDNVLIFGPPGVGKTHLAIAPGRAVVEAGHTVLFTSATALIAGLSKAETEGKLGEQLSFLAKSKLLIVDELGYLPFERRSAHLFFQLVARRYKRGSILITTNQSVSQWGTVFGDDVLAAAILDRLLHHSHTLTIQGESYRLRQKKRAGLLGRAAKPQETEG
jgi:DNA replication protein DnaC